MSAERDGRCNFEPTLSIIFWSICGNWETCPKEESNVNPIFKKGKKEELRNCRLVSFTSIPQKVLEHLILETISRLRKEKKIVSMDSTKGSFGKWQHFYNEIPSLMGEEGSSGGPGGH